MFQKVPSEELKNRELRFRQTMEKFHPGWKMAVIFSKINLYYFTGTMQEGMLFIPRDSSSVLWIRRSYERALNESLHEDIRPMESFRDAAPAFPKLPVSVFIETELVPVAFLKRFQKYFPFADVCSLDFVVGMVRSVKSPWELEIMVRSGEAHRKVLEERVPEILHEGMSEVDLAGLLYVEMLKAGHHGLARFGMFDTEMAIGHIAFGESSLYPTSFNGPGGNYGMSAAVPLLGNRKRKLKKGDLVFIDIGFGIDGYHTDKTLNYIFGSKPDPEVLAEHNKCLEIQDRIAEQLRPGIVPSLIYENIMSTLSPQFVKNFMGFGSRQVKFLGHGIGLVIDEVPVIAKGFDTPLEEKIVLAVEPKKGIENIGVVGIENTFIVTTDGGKCITGSSRGLIPVI
ncbi:MAG TPA: Xaa-Pro peptidase family protein [Bacteroidales bacterium]|jgi:Xaa-Pro aminopeptidase|nr:Xaa-Pro peptidase family protein [Bacteroidales bacterium]